MGRGVLVGVNHGNHDSLDAFRTTAASALIDAASHRTCIIVRTMHDVRQHHLASFAINQAQHDMAANYGFAISPGGQEAVA